ncbi:hypothetical protein [Ligilactobacillus salivarius]|uniref:Uncharacterized protein n=2 Tax=Ligilactobacillus salivarius TaxID=1624 RepID=A0A089QJC7_9LACO|nr:hypothetical protein [Ligilactobacillus salivarius]AIR11848.1 Hypothetical protein LSJ_4071 [Ligilactobacillus salivarius]
MTKKKGLINMANMSTATGRMYLERDFYEKHKELVDKWIKFYQESNHIGEWYGLTYLATEDKTKDELIIEFEGMGRWSWENTLEWIFASKDFESQFNPYKAKLAEKLYEESQEVFMEYVDYEPGCEFLVEKEVTLKVEKYDNKYETSMAIETDIEIGYNDYNKIMNEVEEGYRLDNKEEVKALQVVLKDFYKENEEMITEKNYREFKKDVLVYIKQDRELNGGICLFRLEDPGMFLEDMEDSLKIA